MNDDLRSAQAEAGLRRCALVLHGLGDADRQWLLEQLEIGQRRAVTALLDDLRTLGIAPDANLLHGVLVPAPRVGPSEVPRLSQQAQLTRLAQLLAHEPAQLVAAALHGRADAEAILQALEAPQRREVQAIRQQGRVPARLAACVSEQIEQRLRDGAPAMTNSRWATAWNRLAGIFL